MLGGTAIVHTEQKSCSLMRMLIHSQILLCAHISDTPAWFYVHRFCILAYKQTPLHFAQHW